jgi:hypothetical protein
MNVTLLCFKHHVSGYLSYEFTVFEINNAGNYTQKLIKKWLNKWYNSSVTTLASLAIQAPTETLAGTMGFVNYNFTTE